MPQLSREQVTTAIVALAAGFGGVAGSFAAVGLSREFVVAPIEQLLTTVVPGRIIIFMIENFGSAGQQFSLLMATGLTVVAFAGIAAFGIAVGRRTGTAAAALAMTAGTAWAVAAVLTDAPIAAAGVGLGSGLVVGIAEAAGRDVQSIKMAPERRRIITGSITALGLGALGLGTSGFGNDTRIEREPVDAVATPGEQTGDDDSAGQPDNSGGQTENNDGQTEDTGGQADSEESAGYDGQLSVPELKSLAAERSLDVSSIEPLISENHYTVDINSIDPKVDRDSWTLSVTGEVENELELSFEEVRELQAENRFNTLRCVGDSINGKKMDTAIWTGVPVSKILEMAEPTGACDCVMLRAADDFYEEFPLSALEDGMLAYGMNGETLPRAHGYPMRALVPGHWGEVNVKWLTEIELLTSPKKGYWEKKGWHGTGPVHTVAKLWNDDTHDGIVKHDDGTIELAGHAYAGTRGIERVEVSTDGGQSWADATLTDPLPGTDVWRQWTHTYDSPGRKHEVVVRAYDGEGYRQPQSEQGVYPNGATGWVRQTVKP